MKLNHLFFAISGRTYLATLKPDIIKKPLERRVTKNTRNKENEQISDSVAKSNERASSTIVSQIREKYKTQIENVQVDQNYRTVDMSEFQSVPHFYFRSSGIWVSLLFNTKC